MVIYSKKKYVFCIFHIQQLQAANQTAYIIYVQKVGKKLAKSWTVYKYLQTKIPGKNRIGKSGKIPDLKFREFLIRFWLLCIEMG